MKGFLKEWGRPIGITIGAVICFFLLIKLCFSVTGPTLKHISFDKNAPVSVRVTVAQGEWETVSLSEEAGKTVTSVLNACLLWTSNTCDCADGLSVTVGEQTVVWFGDHFHYSGEDLCVEIPEIHQKKLEKILSPYWERW